MSGSAVTQALRDRFETIRQTEIERLNKKLRGLSDVDRRSLEAITSEIVLAIASVPERALTDDAPQPALDALVRLFALDVKAAHTIVTL
jgi:glutamyl-tRNA reductase